MKLDSWSKYGRVTNMGNAENIRYQRRLFFGMQSGLVPERRSGFVSKAAA